VIPRWKKVGRQQAEEKRGIVKDTDGSASALELLIDSFPRFAMSNTYPADLLFDDYRRRVRKEIVVFSFDERFEE
jgi:hypothetical protein